MENSQNCSIFNCQKPAQVYCDCQSFETYLCQAHSDHHIKQFPRIQHHMQLLLIKISPNQQQQLKQLLSQIQQQKSLSVSQIIQQTSHQLSLLNQQATRINSKAFQSLNSVQEIFNQTYQKIQRYLQQKAVLASSLAQKEFLHLLKNNSTPLPIKISSSTKSYSYFFKRNSKIFCKVNNKTLKVKSRQIPQLKKPIKSDTMCQFNQNQYLYTGSATWIKPFTINFNTFRINQVPYLLCGLVCSGAVVKFNDEYFHFGGHNRNSSKISNQCFKWDGKSDCWKAIAKLPCQSRLNTAVRVGDQILVSGENLNGIYVYKPQLDKFQALFMKLGQHTEKKLLVTSQGVVVCLVRDGGIFTAKKENLRKWKQNGSCRGRIQASSVFTEEGGYLYYVNWYNYMVKINTVSFNLEYREISNI